MAAWREFPSTRTKITFALNFRQALSRRNKLRLLEVRRAVSLAAQPQASLAAQCHRPNGLRFVYMGKSFVPDTVKCHASVTKFLNLLHQHLEVFLTRGGQAAQPAAPRRPAAATRTRSEAAAWPVTLGALRQEPPPHVGDRHTPCRAPEAACAWRKNVIPVVTAIKNVRVKR